MLTLETPIENLARVGSRHATGLRRLGIKTIRDLLWHFPTRYQDFSQLVEIASIAIAGETISIQGIVSDIKTARAWKRNMSVTTATIDDGTDTVQAVWFNQPYLQDSLAKGTHVSLAGKVSAGKRGLYLSNPSYEKFDATRYTPHATHTQGLVPIYPETYGITSKYLRFLIKPLLPAFKNIKHLTEIHFPETLEQAEKARRHFAFEELLLFQLRSLIDRQMMKQADAPVITFDKDAVASFVRSLPFQLTDDQRKAAYEILKDIEGPHPMNRLLNGDVGSGKTVVALIAAYQAALAGYQTVFMAPTELLAFQHYETITSLISPPARSYRKRGAGGEIRIGLLTGSKKIDTNANILIGTHALLEDNIKFEKLGLVVIDEQHRFGIKQRMKLLKGSQLVPHLLSMTATPIPRTLTLTLYGDLDVSLIKQKPAGRIEIITKVIPHNEREVAYAFIDSQMKLGRQVFVICPRIEASESSEMKAVKEEFEKLSKKIFPHRKIAMLHGKVKDKDKIMNDFKNGAYDLVVSTSVIEVGVDIPNATIMMIESAERFGLAQLHQFRGRVGRGTHQSYCYLFTSNEEITSTRRLKAMEFTNDGFKLAEMDLKIRGPGEFAGTHQSGIPDLAMSSLTDIELIQQARAKAKELLAEDPMLKNYPDLRDRLAELQKIVHFE